jgi:hypothetical protein
MNAPIERRATLTKRPVSDDVVAGLTGLDAPPAAPAPVSVPAQRQEPAPAAAPSQTQPAAAPPVAKPRRAATASNATAPVAQRRGPGRPRSRRRMEPFSSKIEISLRDDLDAYLAEHDESIVDFLDRVIRAGLIEPPQGDD